MSEIKGLNLSDVSDGFEPIPAGTYDLSIYEAELRTSQNGNEMIAFVVTVDDPEATEYRGRKLFFNLMLLPQSLWVLKGFLVACGYDKQEIEDAKFTLRTEDLISRKVRANVGLRLWDPGDGTEPTERNEVKTNKFWPPKSANLLTAGKAAGSKKGGLI